jgi:hypothetical protein
MPLSVAEAYISRLAEKTSLDEKKNEPSEPKKSPSMPEQWRWLDREDDEVRGAFELNTGRKRKRKRKRREILAVASSGGERFAVARGRVSARDLRGCFFVQSGECVARTSSITPSRARCCSSCTRWTASARW